MSETALRPFLLFLVILQGQGLHVIQTSMLCTFSRLRSGWDKVLPWTLQHWLLVKSLRLSVWLWDHGQLQGVRKIWYNTWVTRKLSWWYWFASVNYQWKKLIIREMTGIIMYHYHYFGIRDMPNDKQPCPSQHSKPQYSGIPIIDQQWRTRRSLLMHVAVVLSMHRRCYSHQQAPRKLAMIQRSCSEKGKGCLNYWTWQWTLNACNRAEAWQSWSWSANGGSGPGEIALSEHIRQPISGGFSNPMLPSKTCRDSLKFEESSKILIDIKDHKRVMETNHAFAAVMLLQLVPLVRGCPGVLLASRRKTSSFSSTERPQQNSFH